MINFNKNKLPGVLTGIFLITSLLCKGQEESVETINLPPLSDLIEIALRNSKQLRSQEITAAKYKLEENIQKKDWLNSISLKSNYLRGTNQTGVYRNLNPTFTTTASNWYGVGVNVDIPLSLIANRKDKISLQKLNHQIELNYLEELKNELTKLVINSYSSLELKRKILLLRNDAKSQASLNFDYAKMEIKNNTVSISEYSKIHEVLIKAKISLEVAKKEYFIAINELELLVGVKFR